MSTTFTVSVVQSMSSDLDPDGTTKRCLELVDVAGERGSDLIVLPELWTGTALSGTISPASLADRAPAALEVLSEQAQRYGATIIGSLFLRNEDGSHSNCAPVIGPSGDTLGYYHKTHLFDAVNRDDIQGIKESDKVNAGDELPVFDTPLGPVGVTICSDLRFPEPYRVLALRGARILVNCSAFLAPRTDHWEFMLRTRATENQTWVVASGQYGKEPVSGTGFVGRSMVVDPWGAVVASASDRETVLTTEIDMSHIEDVRWQYPLLEQRRPGMYADVAAPVDESGALDRG
ncbi:MAG: carbon-nitrogen hydrolase family protein [Nocardioidaceae bacterium]